MIYRPSIYDSHSAPTCCECRSFSSLQGFLLLGRTAPQHPPPLPVLLIPVKCPPLSRPPSSLFWLQLRITVLEQRPMTSQHGSTAGDGASEFSSPSPTPTSTPTPTPPRNAQGSMGVTAGSSRPLPARLGSGQAAAAAAATSPSPRSPLLAVRPGALKRPSSGSLPVRARRDDIG